MQHNVFKHSPHGTTTGFRGSSMATFVLIHGAWEAGWAWDWMVPYLNPHYPDKSDISCGDNMILL
jgi:hypothetical protein